MPRIPALRRLQQKTDEFQLELQRELQTSLGCKLIACLQTSKNIHTYVNLCIYTHIIYTYACVTIPYKHKYYVSIKRFWNVGECDCYYSDLIIDCSLVLTWYCCIAMTRYHTSSCTSGQHNWKIILNVL